MQKKTEVVKKTSYNKVIKIVKAIQRNDASTLV